MENSSWKTQCIDEKVLHSKFFSTLALGTGIWILECTLPAGHKHPDDFYDDCNILVPATTTHTRYMGKSSNVSRKRMHDGIYGNGNGSMIPNNFKFYTRLHPSCTALSCHFSGICIRQLLIKERKSEILCSLCCSINISNILNCATKILTLSTHCEKPLRMALESDVMIPNIDSGPTAQNFP
jgi:hypothetical protein